MLKYSQTKESHTLNNNNNNNNKKKKISKSSVMLSKNIGLIARK